MQTIEVWLRYLNSGVTWFGLWLVIVISCGPFLIRMATSHSVLAAISGLSILFYGLVVAYTSGWMFGLYPISSIAISLVVPFTYVWAQSASTSRESPIDYSLFLLSTLLLLLAAVLRFDLGDDEVWFGSAVLGLGQFRLDRLPAWLPLLQEGPSDGVLLWNILVSVPTIVASVMTMLILRRREQNQITAKSTARLSDLQNIWLFTTCGWLLAATLYAVYSALLSRDGPGLRAAIVKDFNTPACEVYVYRPFNELQEPPFGDGSGGTCWHLYMSRRNSLVVTTGGYTMEVYEANARQQVLQTFRIRFGEATSLILAVAVFSYVVGTFIAWIGRRYFRGFS